MKTLKVFTMLSFGFLGIVGQGDMDKFQGKEVSELIMAWGTPENVVDLGDTKYMEYMKCTGRQTNAWAWNKNFGTANSYQWCRRYIFEVKNGVIERGRYKSETH